MKKLIILILFLAYLVSIAQGAFSHDPNDPCRLPGLLVETGQTIHWRIRTIASGYDANNMAGAIADVCAGNNPSWVTFGALISPDANRPVFAPRDLDCDQNVVDPCTTIICSRRVTISPPKNIRAGNYVINFSAYNGNDAVTTYWQIPVTVKPFSYPFTTIKRPQARVWLLDKIMCSSAFPVALICSWAIILVIDGHYIAKRFIRIRCG
jgi:hypothetical protein